MHKNNDVSRASAPDIKRIAIGAVMGVAVISLVCLMMACLVVFKVIPERLIVFYAAIAGFIGGFLASAVIGAKGKILLYVSVTYAFMAGLIFCLGVLLYTRPFALSSNPYMLIALLFGLALGSAAVNGR